MTSNTSQTIEYLSLDIGSIRTGVARANSIARLSETLPAISSAKLLENVKDLIEEYAVDEIIVGRPRGLDGDSTQQTLATEKVIERLRTLSKPIHVVDEANTSNMAKEELLKTGKMKNKGDIDSLAALYILDDYLEQTY